MKTLIFDDFDIDRTRFNSHLKCITKTGFFTRLNYKISHGGKVMAQQALNFAQRKNSTLNFLTENDFLQEEKIVVVKSMQKRRRFEQAEQSNTPPGPENLSKSLDFIKCSNV